MSTDYLWRHHECQFQHACTLFCSAVGCQFDVILHLNCAGD